MDWTHKSLNSKRHVVCDGSGRPLRMRLTHGHVSDYEGARLLLPQLAASKALLADTMMPIGDERNEARFALVFERAPNGVILAHMTPRCIDNGIKVRTCLGEGLETHCDA